MQKTYITVLADFLLYAGFYVIVKSQFYLVEKPEHFHNKTATLLLSQTAKCMQMMSLHSSDVCLDITGTYFTVTPTIIKITQNSISLLD